MYYIQIICSSHQNPNGILHKNWGKEMLKFIWKLKKSLDSKKKKNNAGNITVTDLKVYYRSIVTKHGKQDETGR